MSANYPVRAQLALDCNARALTQFWLKTRSYIEALERIHGECLLSSTPQQKSAYEEAKANLDAGHGELG